MGKETQGAWVVRIFENNGGTYIYNVYTTKKDAKLVAEELRNKNTCEVTVKRRVY